MLSRSSRCAGFECPVSDPMSDRCYFVAAERDQLTCSCQVSAACSQTDIATSCHGVLPCGEAAHPVRVGGAVMCCMQCCAQHTLRHFPQVDLHPAQELAAPTALCKRDGKWVELPVKQLVVGDLIQLKGGDVIPADAQVCHC